MTLSGYEYKILLRCRFDYHNKQAPWCSMWNDSGPNLCDKAAFQTKEKLTRAAIEAKNIVTRQIITVAECDGWDFCNFEWIRLAAMAGGGGALRESNIGLSLVTRDARVQVFMNGQVKIESRSECDKKLHLEGYGK